jgi:hypothetical protein
MRKATNRISEGFKGVGTISPEMVRQRARELAEIDGRPADEFTENDWLEAKRELLHPHREIISEDPADEAVENLKQWDMAPGTTGTHKEADLGEEASSTEQLVEEGVNEAEHEQFVEARKLEREKESEGSSSS